MDQINIFNRDEVIKLITYISHVSKISVVAKAIANDGNDFWYVIQEENSAKLYIPSPTELIESGVITAEEYRNSLI